MKVLTYLKKLLDLVPDHFTFVGIRVVTILVFIFIYGVALAYRQGEPNSFSKNLSTAAIERTSHRVQYDGKYRNIGYPNGDVPDNVGVCTDVVIRAYRKLGIDLQVDIH